MKYLLADAIVYNDEDGSVSLINAPDLDRQILTCTANAIMKLLVQHHGNVVERDTFLSDVWDQRGLQGSNNSLNQYISIVRKMLSSLLPDTLFIVTVPKTGFMLSADIAVTPLEDDFPVEEAVPASRRIQPEWLFCGVLTLMVVALCIGACLTKQAHQYSALICSPTLAPVRSTPSPRWQMCFTLRPWRWRRRFSAKVICPA